MVKIGSKLRPLDCIQEKCDSRTHAPTHTLTYTRTTALLYPPATMLRGDNKGYLGIDNNNKGYLGTGNYNKGYLGMNNTLIWIIIIKDTKINSGSQIINIRHEDIFFPLFYKLV